MGTKFNTQIANGSYVEEGTVSQTEWQNRNEQIMSYVKVSSYVNGAILMLETETQENLYVEILLPDFKSAIRDVGD